MACMTHTCPCGHDWFDNCAGGDCPKCGNDKNIGHHWDEEDWDEEYLDEEEDDDQ